MCTPSSSTNTSNGHSMTEILQKVTLNTITLTNHTYHSKLLLNYMSILSYTYVAHIHNAYSVARRILYRMVHNRVE